MKNCEMLYEKFSLTGQNKSVRDLSGAEVEAYQLIYNDLIKKLIDSGVNVLDGLEVQVINKIVSIDDEYITPVGLVNVSLESLAKLLTFARNEGIEWQVEIRECTNTHFKELSYLNINFNCKKSLFCEMAIKAGFRYPLSCQSVIKT